MQGSTDAKGRGNDKVRVLFIQANNFASGYYRVGMIAEWLKKKSSRIEVDYFKQGDTAENFLYRMGEADIVVFQLQTSDIISDAIKVLKTQGIPVVMDMDDDLLNVPEWNPAYFGLGRRYISFFENELGEKMDVQANFRKLNNIKTILRDCSLITVTGNGLRNEYSKFNKAKVIPNAIDPTVMKETPRSTDGKVRIFWQGSATHVADLNLIKPVVQEITRQHPQVQWVIWGSFYKDFHAHMEIPKERVEHHDSVGMHDYYKKLSKMKMDIGICPLLAHPYNYCKSAIKWEEYSMCGIPTVASNVRPYSDAIIGNESGFLANTTQDWITMLNTLIERPEKRDFMAHFAKEQVLRDFNIETMIEKWEDTLVKLHENNPNKI